MSKGAPACKGPRRQTSGSQVSLGPGPVLGRLARTSQSSVCPFEGLMASRWGCPFCLMVAQGPLSVGGRAVGRSCRSPSAYSEHSKVFLAVNYNKRINHSVAGRGGLPLSGRRSSCRRYCAQKREVCLWQLTRQIRYWKLPHSSQTNEKSLLNE